MAPARKTCPPASWLLRISVCASWVFCRHPETLPECHRCLCRWTGRSKASRQTRASRGQEVARRGGWQARGSEGRGADWKARPRRTPAPRSSSAAPRSFGQRSRCSQGSAASYSHVPKSPRGSRGAHCRAVSGVSLLLKTESHSPFFSASFSHRWSVRKVPEGSGTGRVPLRRLPGGSAAADGRGAAAGPHR